MKCYLQFLPSIFFLLFLFNSNALKAQNDSLTIVSVQGKKFLSLIPEAPPKNMVWGKFGAKIESYYGVIAYSNGAKKNGRKYQCTELVHRFLTAIYGIPSSINMRLGHGKDLAENIAIHHKNVTGASDSLKGYSVRLENFKNKKSVYPPVVGSIVSMYFHSQKTGYGHVGIIRDMKINEDGSIEASLFDQHGFAHKKVGLTIQADRLLFEKDSNGHWGGQVLSWAFKRKYPVISWTSPVIFETLR